MPSSEALKRAKKAYYERNKNKPEYKEKLAELQHNYYERNKERIIQRVKAYQANKTNELHTGNPIIDAM